MQKNLQKAQTLIAEIQKNIHNPQKLQNSCQDLQDLIEYLQPTTLYHYQLFLCQIYTVKLADFQNAKNLCKKIVQDKRNTVELEGWLRYSFVNAVEQNYKQAISNLERCKQLQATKYQESIVIVNYFQRLFSHSKDSNLLMGIHYSVNCNRYETAIKYFYEQLESKDGVSLLQNRYFAAKSIKNLYSQIQPNNFAHAYKQKCEQFFSSLEYELQQKDSQILEHNYLLQKRYFDKVFELYNGAEQLIKSRSKQKMRPNNKKIVCDLSMKKILALCKLEKTINLEKRKGGSAYLLGQLQECLKELRNGKFQGYNMVNDFVTQEVKTINKANYIYCKYLFNKFVKGIMGNTYMGSQQKSKGKITRKQTSYNYNSIKNLPTFQSEYSNFAKTQPKLDHSERPDRSPLSKTGKLEYKMHECESQDYISEPQAYTNFVGGYLIKINQNSEGHQKRYFYINRKQYEKRKFKLYYNLKKDKANSENDSYYDFKKFKELEEGKKSKALKRKECQQFQEKLCFCVKMSEGGYKNFYVVEPSQYPKWIYLFNKSKDQKQGKSQTQIQAPSQSAFSAKKVVKQPQSHLSKTNMMKSKKTVNFD